MSEFMYPIRKYCKEDGTVEEFQSKNSEGLYFLPVRTQSGYRIGCFQNGSEVEWPEKVWQPERSFENYIWALAHALNQRWYPCNMYRTDTNCNAVLQALTQALRKRGVHVDETTMMAAVISTILMRHQWTIEECVADAKQRVINDGGEKIRLFYSLVESGQISL